MTVVNEWLNIIIIIIIREIMIAPPTCDSWSGFESLCFHLMRFFLDFLTSPASSSSTGPLVVVALLVFNLSVIIIIVLFS